MPTEDALLNDYAAATLEYCEAAEMIFTFTGRDDEFEQARLRASQTYNTYNAARSALEEHLEHHKCGVKSPAV
jgi:hypothetical protein